MSRAATLPERTWQHTESPHRTLLLRVKKDGNVSALWCVVRGDVVTHRHNAGLVTDENAAEIYSNLFARVEFDFICARAWRDGRWVSLLGEPMPAAVKQKKLFEVLL